jgi:hypothetical protein
MSASQRNKGAGGEREWCEVLKARGYRDAKRTLGQARDGGGDVPCPPVLFEVKRRAGIAVRQFLDQAVSATSQYAGCRIPAVAMREDGRTGWMVLLRAEDFLDLLELTRGPAHGLNVEELL